MKGRRGREREKEEEEEEREYQILEVILVPKSLPGVLKSFLANSIPISSSYPCNDSIFHNY